MPRRCNEWVTRTIIASAFALGLAQKAVAQPVADTPLSSWNECLKTATRACVLREAAELARAEKPSDSWVSSTLRRLSHIAVAQFKASQFADAATTLDGAIQVAKSCSDLRERDDGFRAIATALARTGRLTEALDVAKGIDNRYLYPDALGDIAVAEGQAGKIGEALQRVQAIESLPSRARITRLVAWELSDEAVARGEDGKIVTALQGVQAIEEAYPPPGFFTGIHHPSEFMSAALAIIAEAQARAGKIEDAMQSARLASTPNRAGTFATIARVLARAGAITSALRVTLSIDDQRKRVMVLQTILDQLGRNPAQHEEINSPSLQAEAPDDALNVIPAFTDSMQRVTARAIVAVAFANADRSEKAVELAEMIDESEARALVWRSIGSAQAKAGLTAPSIVSFDRAVQAAMSRKLHDGLLSEIAILQADAGQIDEALRVTALIGGTAKTAGYAASVDGVNSNYERRFALRAIAKAQARAGKLAEAIQSAHALLQGADIIPPGLGVAAEALAEAGRIDEAIEAAAIETNADWRAELLSRIASELAAASRIGDAKQVAQHITDDRDRASALVSIAGAQSKAGLKVDSMATFRDALQIARSLRYKSSAVELLIAVAARLPE